MTSSVNDIKRDLRKLRDKIQVLMEKEILLEADLDIARLRNKNYSRRWKNKKKALEDGEWT